MTIAAVSSGTGIRAAAATDVGKVRTTNEDALIIEPGRGLYVVFDGMGGANAGDVASQMARDVVRDYVVQRRLTMMPRELLEGALIAASTAINMAADESPDKQGMGTTAVGCLVIDSSHVVIGHVGDSRAYLLRNGRLQTLTRDHTIVEELVIRGLLTADEAERHPYKNVLSRNLGAKPDCKVDLLELEVEPGDRLLLCSDGLYGYASAEGIQYILGSGDAPEDVARDLVDLALRGGGGDNVTTIVIEAPPKPQTSTEVVRTAGATAWWQHRQRFLQIAKDRGLPRNPIVRGLDPKEALEVVALSLCQAVYYDLEKSTGVNVWTFAQNLATGWLERGGDWAAVRGMMDILTTSARVVVEEVREADTQLGFLLDIAVSRALVVAELALGGLLADRLRQVDAELIQLANTLYESPEVTGTEEALSPPSSDGEGTGQRFVDNPTIPFLRPDRPVTSPGVSAELVDAIGKAITIARARTAPRADLVKSVLVAVETIATEGSTSFSNAVIAARELYGVRPVDESGVMPLFDALEQARLVVVSSVHQIQVHVALRAKVLRSLSIAHQRLVGATTGLVLEAALPYSERMREVQTVTLELRDQVARAEELRANLERRHASSIDQNLPWGSRGNTEW